MHIFWKIFKNTLKAFFIVFTIIFLFLVVSIFVIRLETVTQKTILSTLKEMGFKDATLAVKELNFTNAGLSNISLGDKENFYMGEINLDFSLRELFSDKAFDNVEITGLKINATQTENGITFGNLDKFLSNKSNKGDISESSLILPFKKILIKDSSFELKTSSGTLIIPFSAEIMHQNGALISNVLSDRVSISFSGFSMPSLGEVTINGLFDIKLPLSYSNNKFEIHDGVIRSLEPGYIRLTPGEGSVLFSPSDPNLALLSNVLKNYDYQSVTLNLDTNEHNKLNMNISIEGANPSLYDGRVVKLNLNIKADIVSILASIVGFENLPDNIRRALEEQTQ